jgi:hypothetical protein
VAVTSTVVELQKQLLAREEELENIKGTIVAWEDGLTTSKRTLGRVCMQHNDEHA